jgi:hypothetical protein
MVSWSWVNRLQSLNLRAREQLHIEKYGFIRTNLIDLIPYFMLFSKSRPPLYQLHHYLLIIRVVKI